MASFLMVASVAWLCFIAHTLAIPANSSYPLSERGSLPKRNPSYGYVAGSISWTSGQTIMSLDGDVDFNFQGDGNLVVTQGGNVVWASYPPGTRNCNNGQCVLVFQSDGNLVAYENSVSPTVSFWATGTNSYSGHSVPAYGLFFRNTSPWIQLYTEDNYMLWETTGTSGSESQNPDAQVETSVGFAPINPTWMSKDAPFVELHNGVLFFLQSDGNIVVHQENSNTVYWASGTTGHNCGTGYCYLQFMSTGQFAAFDASSGSPVKYWGTNTASQPGLHGPAGGLFFRNTPPYISLYDNQDELLWETVGASGYAAYYPEKEAGGGGGGGGGGSSLCSSGVSCTTCYDACAPSPPSDPQEQPEVYPDPPTGTLIQPE